MAKPTNQDTDYDTEMGQRVARAGMEKHVNRNAAAPLPYDQRDQNGNRIGPRRSATPAPAAVQDAYINRAIADEPPVKAAPPPAPPARPEAGSGEAGRAHEAQIMEAVDHDQSGT